MFFLDDRYHLSVVSPKNEEHHEAEEVTIIFLIEGEIKVKKAREERVLKEGSILVMNRGESFRLQPLSNTMPNIIKLTISNLYFVAKFPQFYGTKFHDYSAEEELGKKESMDLLRGYLAELVLVTASVKEEKKIQLSMLINKIMLLLVQQFQKREEDGSYEIYHHKIVEIIVYLEKHFKETITLKSVADTFYMTGPNLSKLFKDETGMNFLTYLNRLRIQNSLKEIMYTKKSIDEIAEANGFNNSKTYRKQFKELMNDSPTNYRKAYQLDSVKKTVSHEDEMDRPISEHLIVQLYGYVKERDKETESFKGTMPQRTICQQKKRESYKRGERIVHIASLENLLNVQVREKLRRSQKDIGVDYIGVHYSIDNKIFGFWSEKTEKIMNVEKVSSIVSFLEENNLGLFYTIKVDEMDAKNLEKYKALLEYIQISKHRNIFDKLKINCQFENIATSATYKQFCFIKKEIQAINPAIQFGIEIPQVVVDNAGGYSKRIAKECDFYTFQAKPNQELYYQRNDFTFLEEYQKFIQKRCQGVTDQIEQWQSSKRVYLTEWNVLEGRSPKEKANFFKEGMALQELIELDKKISGYGFWLDTQIHEIVEEMENSKQDGLVLFHHFFEKNPIYYTLSLLKKLQGKVIGSGGDYLFVQNDSKYQLLIWNVTYYPPELSLDKNFLTEQVVTFKLNFPDIDSGNYQVRQIDLNLEHGSVHQSYEKFHTSFVLDETDYDYLSETSRPLMQVYDVTVQEELQLPISIEANGVLLVEFQQMIL